MLPMKCSPRLFVLWLALFPFTAASAAAQEAQDPQPVRLVLVLNVDSMIPEQLDRLNIWWRGGFRRLMDNGTRFVDAQLPYANTEGAVGHASFGSGCLPAQHGITSNALLDGQSGQMFPCVLDSQASTVSSSDWLVAEQGSASGCHLQREGWAAALRASWPDSRSVSISGKGSSSVLLGGKTMQLALWWDSYGRGFVSSTAYVQELPPWAIQWNATWPAMARDWSWEAHLPGVPSLTGTAADDRPGEAPVAGREPQFPYLAPDLPKLLDPRLQASLASRVYVTPQMDQVVLDLAREAVEGAQLGADDHVDLLALSLSACDLLVSATGPYSLEVTDALLRLDHELGAFFTFLDERVGESRWVVALSSDHGMLDLPEGGAGGVRLRVRARRQAMQLMRGTLLEEFDDDIGVSLTPAADAVTFAPGRLASAEVDAAQVRATIARVLKTLPWVADAYTRDELLEPAAASDTSWLVLARNSYRADGAIELEIRLAHRHLLGFRTGTQSGSPYSYDRRQPLILMGPGFVPGARSGKASSLDALPTVLAALGLNSVEGLDGRDLMGD